jgi:hypothetical protein
MLRIKRTIEGIGLIVIAPLVTIYAMAIATFPTTMNVHRIVAH